MQSSDIEESGVIIESATLSTDCAICAKRNIVASGGAHELFTEKA